MTDNTNITQKGYQPTIRDLRERVARLDTEEELRLAASILNDPEDDDPWAVYTAKQGGRA